MKYIQQLREGDNVNDIYLCVNVQSATTKNGKSYLNVLLQDKTGNLDAKIWEPQDAGIDDFDKLDYIDVKGEVTVFNGAMQLNIKRARKAREGEYDPAEYVPVSRFDIHEMYAALLKYIVRMQNDYLKKLCQDIFVNDAELLAAFKSRSAAKTVHHAFMGGLLEHTLRVTAFCETMAKSYSYLNRDLLICAALCHDIGKLREITPFPENDYSDEGQLLGHIVMGYEMVKDYAKKQEDFPENLLNELLHCILAHHGELEFGSPKKPALAEAVALSFADNTDAKLETMREALEAGDSAGKTGWLGFNRYLDSNIRKTMG